MAVEDLVGESPAARKSFSRTPLKSPPPDRRASVLSPNDDKVERARARQAKRKSFVRKPDGAKEDVASTTGLSALSNQQIIDLYASCIKLATENKINQRNTWGLGLIDHMASIIHLHDEEEETNFQKASCTLDAGVKIYSTRVDSVHTETFKVLGGLHRTEGKAEDVEDDVDKEESAKQNAREKRRQRRNAMPTLESSWEAINIKKWDEFTNAADPLFHKTSAQFDEGGASGLLLNNLCVYHECEILLDSEEYPFKDSQEQATSSASDIDFSSISGALHSATANLDNFDICPELTQLQSLLEELKITASTEESHSRDGGEESVQGDNGDAGSCDGDSDGADFDGGFDMEGDSGHHEPVVTEAGSLSVEKDEADVTSSHIQDSKIGQYSVMSDQTQMVDVDLLSHGDSALEWLATMAMSKSSSWAGPDHWKYRKPKKEESFSANQTAESSDSSRAQEKTSKRKKQEDIDFENPPKIPDNAFSLASNESSISLSSTLGRAPTLLPDDHHYQPKSLAKPFLRSHKLLGKLMLGRSQMPTVSPDIDAEEETNDLESANDHIPDDFGISDDEEDSNMIEPESDPHSTFGNEIASNLVDLPRKVSKISVNYDRRAKQVDVRQLKSRLLDMLSGESDSTEVRHKAFSSVIDDLPRQYGIDNLAQGDISVHLCFICLLHLCNEKGFELKSADTMDEVDIALPVS